MEATFIGMNSFPMEHSWTCSEDLKKFIPPVRKFSVSGSIDRYGFTYVLAKYCFLNAPKRPFAEWIHGWIWDEQPTPETLAFDSLRRSVPVVVRNRTEYDILKNAGFQKVFIGGLPFCYVKKQHDARNDNALLAIPPHSAEVEKMNASLSDYMDFLEAIKKDFDGVYVSIFHLDWGGAMHKAAEARGLNVILGARPDDANSLLRTRAIFDAFKFVTTNVMGSHFVYATSAGCNFSFAGPFYHYDEDIYIGNGNIKGHSAKTIDRFMEVQSLSYLRKRFEKFFACHPVQGSVDTQFGQLEIGASNLLTDHEVRNAIGWTALGQISGYARGGANRVRRLIGGKQ